MQASSSHHASIQSPTTRPHPCAQGKVVMSMVKQFGPRLPRPLQVWALDALPGEVRAGEQWLELEPRSPVAHASCSIISLLLLLAPVRAHVYMAPVSTHAHINTYTHT